MLAHHRKFVCLSLTAIDLPLQSTIETAATFYRKDADRFHILLKQPAFPDRGVSAHNHNGLLWLELSSDRVVMTMQGCGKLGYRHFWDKNGYGMSRYWLHDETLDRQGCLQLKNFTQQLHLSGSTFPECLRLEYRLYAGKLQLGIYLLSLDIQH